MPITESLSEAGTVRCLHGANEQNLSLGGRTVAWVRKNLRDALNLGYWSEAMIEGRPVMNARVFAAGECLEFLIRVGFKGSNREPVEHRKARGLLNGYPELMSIGEEVRLMGLDGSASIEETLLRVVLWAEDRFGPVPRSESPTLHAIVEILTRIESRLDKPLQASERDRPSSLSLSIKQVARSVNLSESHIRRAIARGVLIASNVGTAARSTWRLSLVDLEAWLGSKKGGHPKVPPSSDFKDLIRRHLPGL
jgi:hypothetical protein